MCPELVTVTPLVPLCSTKIPLMLEPQFDEQLDEILSVLRIVLVRVPLENSITSVTVRVTNPIAPELMMVTPPTLPAVTPLDAAVIPLSPWA